MRCRLEPVRSTPPRQLPLLAQPERDKSGAGGRRLCSAPENAMAGAGPLSSNLLSVLSASFACSSASPETSKLQWNVNKRRQRIVHGKDGKLGRTAERSEVGS